MTVDAASTANRLFTIEQNTGFSRLNIVAIEGGGNSYPLNINNAGDNPGPYSFVASGTAPVVIYATPLDSSSAATHRLLGPGTATQSTIAGGTGTVGLRKITLA
jgi:hypothetical protein